MTHSELRSLPFAIRWGMRLCFLRSQRRPIAILLGSLAAVAIASLSLIAFLAQGERYSIEIGSRQERALMAYLALADDEAAKRYSDNVQAATESGSPHTRVSVSQAKAWVSQSSPLTLAALSKGSLPGDIEALRVSALAQERLKATLLEGMGAPVNCSFGQVLVSGFVATPYEASCWEPDLKLGFWLCSLIPFLLISLLAWFICTANDNELIENPISFFQWRRLEWMERRADDDFRRVERALLVFTSKRARPSAEAKKAPRL